MASHHDDPAGLFQIYSFRSNVGVTHLPFGSHVIVGANDSVLTGVLAAIVRLALDAVVPLQVAAGQASRTVMRWHQFSRSGLLRRGGCPPVGVVWR